jgi:hypothetical protein
MIPFVCENSFDLDGPPILALMNLVNSLECCTDAECKGPTPICGAAGRCQADPIKTCVGKGNVPGKCPQGGCEGLAQFLMPSISGPCPQCCVQNVKCSSGGASGTCQDQSVLSCQYPTFGATVCAQASSGKVQCCPSEKMACTTTSGTGECMDETSCATTAAVPISSSTCDPMGQKCCVKDVACSTPDGLYNGNCKNTASCSGVSLTDLCPGSASFTCCFDNLPPGVCVSDSKYIGKCSPVDECIRLGKTPLTMFGTSQGCGAGQSCCVTPPGCSSTLDTTVYGTCVHEDSCKAKSVSGLCPGGNEIKCCIELGTCHFGGIVGQCMDKDECNGPNVYIRNNLCPGSNEIKCCTEYPSCENGEGDCRLPSGCSGSSTAVASLDCPTPTQCCLTDCIPNVGGTQCCNDADCSNAAFKCEDRKCVEQDFPGRY